MEQNIKLVRQYTQDFIPLFLSVGYKTRHEIDHIIRESCPFDIDWNLPCTCSNGNGNPEEWRHQVGLGLWSLRTQGIIKSIKRGLWCLSK